MQGFEDLSQLPVSSVPVDALLAADSPRLLGEQHEHVRLLAQAAGPLPPIVICRSTMRVIDGMHRLEAAKLRGDSEISVRFFDGDEAHAFILAVRTNIAHGLPLSLADRKVAVARILNENSLMSDRMIADAAGVSAKVVAAIRRRPTEARDQLDTRLGRDGRSRPLNGAERRSKAAKLIADKPHASLREIARQAGLSPETVRDVRARLSKAPASSTNAGGRRARYPRNAMPPAGQASGQVARELRSLTADPALRSSEKGRLLLRILAMSKVLEGRERELADAVPVYSRDRVARLARYLAQIMLAFARDLDTKSDGR